MPETDVKKQLILLKEQVAKACMKCGRDANDIRIVAVTKTHEASVVQACIDAGIRNIGENRVQEIVEKTPRVHGNFEMHLIGHLQTNKVAKVLPFVQWIHSIDSVRLIDAIAGRVSGKQPSLNALVEVNTSGEASKSGCLPSETLALCEKIAATSGLTLRGLMTVGPLGGNETALRNSFAQLRKLSESVAHLITGKPELSMGMSDDFTWAIEEGSTIIRIGSMLVGKRDYGSESINNTAVSGSIL